MNRRRFLTRLLGVSLAAALWPTLLKAEKQLIKPFKRPTSFWKQRLSSQAYAVLFEEATEKPWSSKLNEEKREGTYICSACYLPLFSSLDKYDSGTGWPSFKQAISGHIATKRDWKLLIPRTEYHCARCGGHQGHVFNDGPKPIGQRWCNNGVALHFVEQSQPLPELRG